MEQKEFLLEAVSGKRPETKRKEKDKAGLYVRLSEEDRDKVSKEVDSRSIQNQKNLLLNYCMEKGWEVYKIYSDDDYTGSDRLRPAFNALIQDAEEGKFNIVLCKSQARFTREIELVEKYIHGLFPLWGIRFIGVADNADTNVKENKKSRQINGLVNEWYLEDMSANIRAVLDDKRKNGMHIGAFACYGYKKDPECKGHLVIDEEAADVVRRIFDLYIEGYGKKYIAKILNEEGIMPPMMYRKSKGLYKQNISLTGRRSYWQDFTIKDILSNEMYIGNMIQGRYGSESYKTKKNRPRPKEMWFRKEGTHEPVIDMKVWNQAKDLQKQRSRPRKEGKIGIFARKTKCMYCGYVLRSSKVRQYYYLKCTTRSLNREGCIGCFIAQRKLENIVLEQINAMIEEYLDPKIAEEYIEVDQDSEKLIFNKKKDIANRTSKLERINTAIRNLYIDKTDGLLTAREYIDFKSQFEKDREQIAEEIKAIQTEMEEMEKNKIERKTKKEILKQFTTISVLNRDIIDALINYIEVGKSASKAEETPIVIHWKF